VAVELVARQQAPAKSQQGSHGLNPVTVHMRRLGSAAGKAADEWCSTFSEPTCTSRIRSASCSFIPRGVLTAAPRRGSRRTGQYFLAEPTRTKPTRRARCSVTPRGAAGQLGSVATAAQGEVADDKGRFFLTGAQAHHPDPPRRLWCYSPPRGEPTRISGHCSTRRDSGRIGQYLPTGTQAHPAGTAAQVVVLLPAARLRAESDQRSCGLSKRQRTSRAVPSTGVQA
jgi:hypothetical protein